MVVSSETPMIEAAHLAEPAGAGLQALGDFRIEAFLFLALRVGNELRIRFGLGAEQDVKRGIAAIIKDHVGRLAIGPVENLCGVLPVFLQASRP